MCPSPGTQHLARHGDPAWREAPCPSDTNSGRQARDHPATPDTAAPDQAAYPYVGFVVVTSIATRHLSRTTKSGTGCVRSRSSPVPQSRRTRELAIAAQGTSTPLEGAGRFGEHFASSVRLVHQMGGEDCWRLGVARKPRDLFESVVADNPESVLPAVAQGAGHAAARGLASAIFAKLRDMDHSFVREFQTGGVLGTCFESALPSMLGTPHEQP